MWAIFESPERDLPSAVPKGGQTVIALCGALYGTRHTLNLNIRSPPHECVYSPRWRPLRGPVMQATKKDWIAVLVLIMIAIIFAFLLN